MFRNYCGYEPMLQALSVLVLNEMVLVLEGKPLMLRLCPIRIKTDAKRLQFEVKYK